MSVNRAATTCTVYCSGLWSLCTGFSCAHIYHRDKPVWHYPLALVAAPAYTGVLAYQLVADPPVRSTATRNREAAPAPPTGGARPPVRTVDSSQ